MSKYCKNCGIPLDADEVSCLNCGAAATRPEYQNHVSNSRAIDTMVPLIPQRCFERFAYMKDPYGMEKKEVIEALDIGIPMMCNALGCDNVFHNQKKARIWYQIAVFFGICLVPYWLLPSPPWFRISFPLISLVFMLIAFNLYIFGACRGYKRLRSTLFNICNELNIDFYATELNESNIQGSKWIGWGSGLAVGFAISANIISAVRTGDLRARYQTYSAMFSYNIIANHFNSNIS